MFHKKHQCFQCHYEKTCDGLSFQQRKSPCCDIIKMVEYQKLINDQKTALQNKVDEAIAEAIEAVETKQSQLWNLIESDPRIPWKFQLENITVEACVEASSVQDEVKVEQQLPPIKSHPINGSSSKHGNIFRRESSKSRKQRGGKSYNHEHKRTNRSSSVTPAPQNLMEKNFSSGFDNMYLVGFDLPHWPQWRRNLELIKNLEKNKK